LIPNALTYRPEESQERKREQRVIGQESCVSRRVALVFSIGLFAAACGLPALVLHNRAYLDNSR
jgi:hypothetical protein